MKLSVAALMITVALPAFAEGIQAETEDRIAGLASSLVHDILGTGPGVDSPLDDAVSARIAQSISEEPGIPQPEAPRRNVQEELAEREQVAKNVFWNLGKGLAIILSLLLLRWLITFMDLVIRGDTAREKKRLASLVGVDANTFAVVVPTPSQEDARRIGQSLIESRLAAYAGIVGPNPILTQDPHTDRQEAMLVLLTRRNRLKKMRQRVRHLHGGDDPHILPFAIRQGHKPFIKQIRKATSRFA